MNNSSLDLISYCSWEKKIRI